MDEENNTIQPAQANNLNIDLEHKRFRHMSEEYLKAMNPSLQKQKLSKCQECNRAKLTRTRVKTNLTRRKIKQKREKISETEAGEHVASDLKEMYEVGTGGCKYMGSALDVHSRYAMIVALKTKGEFKSHYEDIVTWYTTQTGRPFKKWTTDGGGEMNNKQTDNVNRKNGIQHQQTPPHTSRKNPFAERFNRTIGEAVAAMLLTAGMTAAWWVEAIYYAVYIYNRTPHKGIQMRTPYQIFYGKSHHAVPVKVFGCLALVYDHKNTKKDLDKTRRSVFLGIDTSGRCKFLDLSTKNRFTADVSEAAFYEDIFPLGKHKQGALQTQATMMKSVDVSTKSESGLQIFLLDDSTETLQNLQTATDMECTNKKETPDCDATGSIPVALQSPADPTVLSNSPQHVDAADQKFYPNDEYIENYQHQNRYPTRIRNMSEIGLQSAANTPPAHKYTSDIGRLNHRELQEIANALLYTLPVPSSYHQARLSPDWPKWQAAIEKEVKALKDKNTFEEVYTLPGNKKALTCRWVFKVKDATKHEPEIYKARLVVQGFKQKEGTDFGETFAAVARTTSLRILIALAAAKKTRMTKLDVANAFLSSKMDVELYVRTPEGYPSNAPFLKLLQALYGLKQAPRLWYGTLIKELESMGFEVAPTDSCIMNHKTKNCTLVIVVDDIIVCTNDKKLRNKIEQRLDEKFKIKAFGDVKTYFGLEVKYTDTSIILRQKAYILKLLERFNMTTCKPAKTPAAVDQSQDKDLDKPAPPGTPYRELVGSLLYLFATRPDICVAVIKLSMHLDKPTQRHWMQAKRVLRYLAGTVNKGVEYPKNVADFHLWAHTDSDWAGCKTTRRSTSGYAIFLDKGPICWRSKMQSIVALSTCEAEYIALVECIKEILWLLQHLQVLGVAVNLPVVIGIDNQAAIALAKNPVLHEKTKHIDTRHHFIRQAVQKGYIKLQYIKTDDNIADVLTKFTKKSTFEAQTQKLLSKN